MAPEKTISGFSKLNKRGKIKWIVENFFKDPEHVMRELMSYWHHNEEHQKVLDGFSENTISNFILPYSVAPNFVINGKTYCVPMVIEESSVVAASSNSAKFWMTRGGFHAEVLGTVKVGQVFFSYEGDAQEIKEFHHEALLDIVDGSQDILANMQKRGGGIRNSTVITYDNRPRHVQIQFEFETCDSMGANFINTFLERYAKVFITKWREAFPEKPVPDKIMAILSNYTPRCLVKAWVECPVEELGMTKNGMGPQEFAKRFYEAVDISKNDTYRATTHNKGIFNGIDAVVIATGNDFRAIEACGHAYAARDGAYRGLSDCSLNGGVFTFSLTIPLAVGTVGGLTATHPIARRSLELLGHPGAKELMKIIACVGLAQNFAALRSLVTTGIQEGHMRMHFNNILNQLKATQAEAEAAQLYFVSRTVSYAAVRQFLEDLRQKQASNTPSTTQG